MTLSQPQASGRAPAAAYRKDSRGRRTDQPFGDADGAWILVASLLRAAAAQPGRLDVRALQAAHGAARQALGVAALERGAPSDAPSPECSVLLPLRLLAEEMEESGALHLAAGALDALLAIDLLSDIERGRLLAQRARIARKLGELDRAASLYRTVAGLARGTGSAELRVRALVGRAILSQIRGNAPEVYRRAGIALRLAERHGLDRLGGVARHCLMVADAHAGRFDRALQQGWQVYLTVLGDPAEESAILGNLGQLLLDMHMAEAARDAFAALFVRSASPRVIVPALGGFALASAASGALADVRWAEREILRARSADGPPYDTAVALLETATALSYVGDEDAAARMRDAATEIADRHGYHELSYRARAMPRRQPAADATSAPAGVATVARAIHGLRPHRLPAALAGLTAP